MSTATAACFLAQIANQVISLPRERKQTSWNRKYDQFSQPKNLNRKNFWLHKIEATIN
jgi:hypothetical protein